MAAKTAAASTHSVAAEAATQAFHTEGGEAPATAIDAALAGVLALAARHSGVLLGSGTILLGGTGEGQLALDARARQPGIGSPRPRGFTDPASIPEAARIAAPILPAALTLAHAGRGVRTRTAMMRIAIDTAKAHGPVDDARIESLRAFGREGGGILRGGLIRETLLAAAARSLGGTLTREDLDALQPSLSRANLADVAARRWATAPWSDPFAEEQVGGAARSMGGELAIVATCDSRGAVAVLSVLVPTMSIALPDIGLAAPQIARPVLRGVAREPAGAPISLPSGVGIAQGRTVAGGKSELAGVDLALGVGGMGDVSAIFARVARAASTVSSAIEDAFTEAAEHPAAGVMIDSRGFGRALSSSTRSAG